MIEKFKHNDWIKQWAGNWSILSFSYWGSLYTKKPFTKNIDRYVEQSIIIWRDGKSYAYQRTSSKKLFGAKLVKIIKNDDSFVVKLCNDLKQATDNFLDFVEKYKGNDIDFAKYTEYQNLLSAYYVPHIQIKVGVDYLEKNLLDKYLSELEKTRLYAEPVFNKSIEFMHALADIHSAKTKYSPELILATINKEFEKYYQDKNLPQKNILEKRTRAAMLLSDKGSTHAILEGQSALNAENKLVKTEKKSNILHGTAAYKGKIKGCVRIIFNPRQAKLFQDGDILVTGMTRPDYLPLIKKAGAVVTDAGGVLCHAAIVARELKKPTIVGTEVATKTLKDGDLVEVDANKGVVKVLKRA